MRTLTKITGIDDDQFRIVGESKCVTDELSMLIKSEERSAQIHHSRLQASVFKSSREETPLFLFAKSRNHKEAVATGHLKHINENSIRKHHSFVPDGFAEKDPALF